MQSFKSVKLSLLQVRSDLNDIIEELSSIDKYDLSDAEIYVSDAVDMIEMALDVL